MKDRHFSKQMKWSAFFCALLLSVMFPLLAFGSSDAITFTNMTCINNELSYEFFVNRNYREVICDLFFYNSNNQLILMYDRTMEGYLKEICEMHFTKLPFGHFDSTRTFDSYPPIAYAVVGVRQVTDTSGNDYFIPDSEIHWYSSKTNAYINSCSGEPATISSEILLKASEFEMGIAGYNLSSKMSEAYGFSEGGFWIAEVTDGSVADHYGILTGDLIYAANGKHYKNDPYFLERARADYVDGKDIKLNIFRKGNAVEINISHKVLVTSIKLNKTKATLKKGQTLQLKVKKITPENATNKKVIWTTSDKKIARVNSEGKVTAKKKGTCLITCTAADGSGVIAVCKITVK